MKIIRRFLFIVLVAAVLAVVLYGCATVPETGRSQLILVDAGQVAQMSLAEFEKIKQSTPISRNAEDNAQVKRVGLRIAAVAPVPNAKWEFVVFDKPDVLNAFALPGGKVGVYSGLFKITKDDAGLATVLAHEVGHVVARHGAERVSEGLLVQLGGAVLAEATKTQPGATQQIVQAAYGIGSGIGLVLPHSRLQESEADHLGLIYMARAGYDPQEAVEFWKRFSAYNKQHGGGQPLEFLSTHPLDERRIAQIQSLLPQVLPEYQKAKR
ncbi:MAG TPA: M48 family metallopeptidase [Burkholderiales bacterium]|jgi:predicted Zn-dependent protease